MTACTWCGDWALDYTQDLCAPAGEDTETACRECGRFWQDERHGLDVPTDDAKETA